MTVMNNRAQGGSVIERGRVELMQNRRYLKDDARGLGPVEVLKDDEQNPAVPATYYVQLFNRSKRISLQRVVQQRVD
jgi:hypothetical protein